MFHNKKPKPINPDEIDPNVYLYDEVYDDIKREEREEKEKERPSEQKKVGSKYIDGLKETAELRKAEKEHRKFKKYARDRDSSKDVEHEQIYITDSYKKRLHEMENFEKKKRLELENDEKKSMNFAKITQQTKVNSRSNDTSNIPPDVVIKDSSEVDDSYIEPNDSKPPNDKGQTERLDTRPRKPQTMDERKKLLRQILAKRTIGSVYSEAVTRYRRRKDTIRC